MATSMYQAQAAAAKDIRTLFAQLADRIGGIILRIGSGTDRLSRRQQDAAKSDINTALDGVFVGPDGRQPYGVDGITPLAAYPRILNTHLGSALEGVVNQHRSVMQAALPADVQRWLQNAKPGDLPDYDPPHSWIAPGGQRLSDLIWRNDYATRLKLDQALTEAVQRNLSAEDMARQISGLVRGDRRYITSYVSGANIPYDALRLARTTLAAATAQAAIATAKSNPSVSVGIDWRLSIKHVDYDNCNKKATLDGQGNRLKAAYAPDSVPTYPDHPNCLCGLEALLQPNDQAIQKLIQDYRAGKPAPFTPLAAQFPNVLIGLQKRKAS